MNPLQCNAKDSHIFSTKKNRVFVIFYESLTNNIVNFEQLGPDVYLRPVQTFKKINKGHSTLDYKEPIIQKHLHVFGYHFHTPG